MMPVRCADQVWRTGRSTVSRERRTDLMLHIEDRNVSIDRKTNENHYQPCYLRLMENLSFVGGYTATEVLKPQPMSLGVL